MKEQKLTSRKPDKIVVKEESTEEENKDFEDEFQDEEPPATDISQLDNQSVDITVEDFFLFPISCVFNFHAPFCAKKGQFLLMKLCDLFAITLI